MSGEWDESLPKDHLKIGDLPKECRKITEKVETVLIKEHEDLGDGNTGGQHRQGSAVANEGTTTPTKTVDITAGDVALTNIAGDRGRLWLDDNFDPPVLKRWSGTAWEVVGTIAAGASPNLAKLISTTAEDSDVGRESALVFKGTQSGARETTLGMLEFSHEGSSDDEKGQLKIKVNDGDDGDAPSKVALVVKSTGKIDASESLAILDEDDMASDDADVLATQQSIKAYIDTAVATEAALRAFGEYSREDDDTNNMVKAHAYLANQDGIVTAILTSSTTGHAIAGYVDGTNDPAGAGELIASYTSYSGSSYKGTITFPVKSGKYFEITDSSGAEPVIYWHPIGTLVKPTDQD